jgi:hypothetical protein
MSTRSTRRGRVVNIREVQGSNPGSETNYAEVIYDFPQFFLVNTGCRVN